MWFQVFLAVGFILTTLRLMRTKERKWKTQADGSPNPVLGTLTTLQMLLSFTKGGSTPNYEILTNWAKACGGLIIANIPIKNSTIVSIADLSIAKRIMNSSSWANRLPDDHYLYSSHFNKPLGLFLSNGNWWKEARQLTLKLLHQLDFFRMENVERFINLEISQVKSNVDEQLKTSNGEIAIRVHHMFVLPALNIVYQVIMGKRFEHGDPFIKELFHLMDDYSRNFNTGTSVLEVVPWLSKIPGLTYLDSYDNVSQVCYKYFKQVMEHRRKSGAYRTDPQDFADYFLLEIDQRASQNPCYLTDEAFLVCMRDMILAGSDTTNSTLEHGILHVSLRPEIQRKVQAEIDDVIGPNRGPSYEDRKNMPYTQAVLLEVLRYASPTPLTSRSPLEDNEINGSFVRKGSLCGINIYAIHRSPDLWDDPEVFRPERFLNDQMEIVNTEKIIPFGYGKRLCVGENVARMALFIFFTSMMQKYSFEISPNHPPPSMKNGFGMSRYPMPYYVNVRPRS